MSDQGGLQFEALIRPQILNDDGHVTSGWLSDLGECYVRSFSVRAPTPISCKTNLQTVKHVENLLGGIREIITVF